VPFLAGSFSAGSADTLDGQGGVAGPFSDNPILFFDRGARGSIPIKATKGFHLELCDSIAENRLRKTHRIARILAASPVFVPFLSPVVAQAGYAKQHGNCGIARTCHEPGIISA
jgi:hypothetical protein